jgi:hypothetical protein
MNGRIAGEVDDRVYAVECRQNPGQVGDIGHERRDIARIFEIYTG